MRCARRCGSRWLVVLTLVTSGCAAPPDGPERIVLVVADMLRRDRVGAYGGRDTPNIDALAQRGTRFANAVASYHQTTMSMAALFTGRTPSLEMGGGASLPWNSATWCGMARLRPPGDSDESCLPHTLETISESLAARGYETIGVTSNPLLFRPAGYEQGFDRWVEVGEAASAVDERVRASRKRGARRMVAGLRSASRVNEAALEAVDARESDRFLLYVHYMDVHDFRWVDASYRDAVERIDSALGELLAALEERGLLEGSRVVFLSDHGEVLDDELPLPAALHLGNPSFDAVLSVPLIVAPPVDVDEARMVRLQDVGNLILGVGDGAPGGSEDTRPDELFVSEMVWQTYRRGRWKSMKPRALNAFYPHLEPARSSQEGAHFLFDLLEDPGEQRNVASLHPDVRSEHARRLGELSEHLAGKPGPRSGLSRDDEQRLRALGYLDDE